MSTDDWDLTELDPDLEPRDAARWAELWQVLEQDRIVPDRALLALLSNLLDDDLLRMRTLWPDLALPVRRELIAILEELADADFALDFYTVFRIALTDQDAEVRAAGLRGLDEVEDVRLVPDYVHILRSDPSFVARQAAAQGLGRFVLLGELEKLRPDPFRRAVQALQASYTDPNEDPLVRQRAVEAMAYTGDYGVPAMIKRAYADGDDGMRRSAIIAMGRSADGNWGALVQRELINTDPRMRLAAVRAAGEIQIRDAAQEIVSLTDDVDADVQTMSLWALGQIGGALARKTLQRFARGEDEDLASIAEEALQELEFLYGDATTFVGVPESFSGETDGAWRFPKLGELADPDEEGDTGEASEDVGDEEEDADDVTIDDTDYLVGYLSAEDDTAGEDEAENDDLDDDYDALDDSDDDDIDDDDVDEDWR